MKSTCELIARRSVLSSPDIFLPHMLICCGLSQSSFFTVLNRLNDLGSSVSEPGNYFKKLLLPLSALKGLKRIQMIRLSLSRISAYMRLFSNDDISSVNLRKSSCFISWLEAESASVKENCSALKKSKSQKIKCYATTIASKSNDDVDMDSIQLFPTSADNCLWRLSNLDNIQRGTAAPSSNYISEKIPRESNIEKFLDDLHVSFEQKGVASVDPELIPRESIIHLLSSQNFYLLNRLLDELYSGFVEKGVNASVLEEIASLIILASRSLLDEHSVLQTLILHWIPVLTRRSKSTFWDTIFRHRDIEKTSSVEFEKLLLTRCFALWSTHQITTCQRWILSEINNEKCAEMSINSCLRCFLCFAEDLKQSDFHSGVTGTIYKSVLEILEPKDQTEAAVKLALLGAQEWSVGSNSTSDLSNNPPWMLFLLLIGSIDKKHLNLLSEIIMSKLPSSGWEGKVLPLALLKLYGTFPSRMDVSGCKIRDILVDVSIGSPQLWLDWETHLDCRLVSAMSLLSSHSNSQKLIFDIIKKHPLIAVKHMKELAELISRDANAHFNHENVSRNKHTHAQSSLLAIIDEREKLVHIIHWGMRFTEHLWLAVLDMIASFPEAIIYSKIGWLMGLDNIFNMFLKLLFIHSDTNNDGVDVERLRNKFVTIFKSCYSNNQENCNAWLESTHKGFKKHSVKDIMAIIGFTQPTQMDSEISTVVKDHARS